MSAVSDSDSGISVVMTDEEVQAIRDWRTKHGTTFGDSSWEVAVDRLLAERDALAQDAARYAIARRMSPQQWADAWELNHRTGKPFDEIIDDLAPFFDAAMAGREGRHERR